MEESILSLPVSEVMARWPASVRFFTARRMACPGCVMAPFMTLREAAREYGQEPVGLAADLIRAVERDTAG